MSEETSAESPYPQPGDVLDGKYEIQRVLGTGAMGAVVRATHLLRKAPVALKFMSPDVMHKKGIVQRFLNEGVAASQIDSDHAVKVLDVCELPSGVPYLVMEYLEGLDLKELLERDGAPGLDDIPRVVHLLLQILRGLQVAHRVAIVHRDMKPANVFIINKDGEPDFVKIVDFGISKIRQPDQIELTNVGSALGTPLYMSPEQARSPKDVDARSDLYAVAAIAYEMVSGQPPFVPESGTLSELMIKLGTEEPASLEETRSDLPGGFWQAIARGLEKNPDHRYQNALEFAEALAPYADERSNHVLRQMSSRTSTGVSRFPPAPGPPTHVDEHPAGAKETGVEGTVLIPEGDNAALEDGVAAAMSQVATLDPDALDPDGSAPAPVVDVGHDTQQGTVKDAEPSKSQQRSPMLFVALGAGALIGAVVLAFAFSGSGDANPAVAPTAEPDKTTPTAEVTVTTPAPPTAEVTATATATSSADAPPAKVPVSPVPKAVVPKPPAPAQPVPQPPVAPPTMDKIGIDN